LAPVRFASTLADDRRSRNDPRIDINLLRKKLGKRFPRGAKEQTSVWYGLYHRYAHAPAVTTANRAYLLLRDMTALTVLSAPTAAIFCIYSTVPASNELRLLVGLVLEYLLVRMAARNAGYRLVANVLAMAAQPDPPRQPHVPSGNLSSAGERR
jgi:hypothetical protein